MQTEAAKVKGLLLIQKKSLLKVAQNQLLKMLKKNSTSACPTYLRNIGLKRQHTGKLLCQKLTWLSRLAIC